jgi:3-carboxy-cis,cis-muconate cycloisomerase
VADPLVSAHLSAAEVDAALDPAGYLGSAEAFIDRALDAHRGDEDR